MNKTSIISLIEETENINKEDNISLKNITDKYPFFSIGHILYAKGLLNTESLLYNQQLKRSSLYALNRQKLFTIISENSKKKDISEEKQENNLKGKTKSKKLNIGTPIKFQEEDEYSFSEWMKITKIKKIKRKDSMELIDDFLDKNPTIVAKKNNFFSPHKTAKSSLTENNDLVTETLAKVYLEQGHFNKAIESYKKLSLKYPKKSSFFANQIKLINQLRKK